MVISMFAFRQVATPRKIFALRQKITDGIGVVILQYCARWDNLRMRQLSFMQIWDQCPLLRHLFWVSWFLWDTSAEFGIRSQGLTYLRIERLSLQSWLPAGWYQGHSLCKIISHIALPLQSGLWQLVLNLKKKKKKVQFSIDTKDDKFAWSIIPLQCFSLWPTLRHSIKTLLYFVSLAFFSW